MPYRAWFRPQSVSGCWVQVDCDPVKDNSPGTCTRQTDLVFRSLLIASAVLVAASTTGFHFASTAGQRISGSTVVQSSERIDPSECNHPEPVIGRPAVLSVRIVHIDAGAVALVNACISGAGPFPFVIDSGSSFSVISTQISRRVHLHQAGATERAAGIGCSANVVPERLSSWSVGGLALRPQGVYSASLPNLEPNRPLAGVIGSDVLSRFGSVRIDYQKQTVSLGAPESGSPTANGILGPTSTPTPAQFVRNVRAEAELTVVARQGGVVAYAPIEFNGSGTQQFVVDTGAAVSIISPLLARSLHLANAHRSVDFSGAFGCPVNLAEVKSGPWTLGSTSLPPQMVASIPASGIKIAGVVGSDVLSRFGAVVIDYRAARILLESG